MPARPRPSGAEPAFDALVTALAHWADRHSQPSDDAGVAVAYSGGADSSALLHAACALWPGRVQAFHVHHGLQQAADAFVAHAQRTCDALQVPLRVQRVHAQPAPGQSPEEAARRARYLALTDMARAHGVHTVLLGHHAHDQMETVFLALSRGAGLPGLSGMPETALRQGVHWGRPWLAIEPSELRQALRERGLDWVEDPTNAQTDATRNRLRAALLPVWQGLFPAGAQTLARSARHAAEAQTLLDELADTDLQHTGRPPALSALQALSPARQANALRRWWRLDWGVAPSEAQLAECLRQIAACRTRGHRLHLRVAGGWLDRDGARLVWRPGHSAPPPSL